MNLLNFHRPSAVDDGDNSRADRLDWPADARACTRRDRLLTTAGVVAAFIVVLVGGTRTYETNDNVQMAAIVSGEYTGEPDGRLVFIDPLVSFPIAWLYDAARSVPWFALTLYTVHLASVIVIFDVFRRRYGRIGWLPTASAIGAVVAVEPRFLLLISFTSTAFVATIGASVLLIDALTDGGLRPHWLRALVGLALFGVGLSMRMESALGVLVVAAPVLLVTLFRNRRAAVLVVAAPTAVVALNWAIPRFVLDHEYREYLAYNALRGQLHGTPRLAGDQMTDELLREMGWGRVDYRLFRAFFFDDPDRFTAESLEIALAGTTAARESFSLAVFWEVVVFRYPYLFFGLVAAIAGHLLLRRWKAAVLSALLASVGIVAMEYLRETKRLPDRVALPMWMAICVLAAITALATSSGSRYRRPSRGPQRSWLPALAVGLGITLAGWSSIGPTEISIHNDGRRTTLNEQLDALDAMSGISAVLSVKGGLMIPGGDPLRPSAYADERVLTFGWGTFSPMFELRKATIGISEPMRVMYGRDDVVLLAGRGIARQYEQFLAREFPDAGLPSRLVPVSCPTSNRCLWLVDRAPESVGDSP